MLTLKYCLLAIWIDNNETVNKVKLNKFLKLC
jgi:hypothetical protein